VGACGGDSWARIKGVFWGIILPFLQDTDFNDLNVLMAA
jgi:hypothetical protein